MEHALTFYDVSNGGMIIINQYLPVTEVQAEPKKPPPPKKKFLNFVVVEICVENLIQGEIVFTTTIIQTLSTYDLHHKKNLNLNRLSYPGRSSSEAIVKLSDIKKK